MTLSGFVLPSFFVRRFANIRERRDDEHLTASSCARVTVNAIASPGWEWLASSGKTIFQLPAIESVRAGQSSKLHYRAGPCPRSSRRRRCASGNVREGALVETEQAHGAAESPPPMTERHGPLGEGFGDGAGAAGEASG